jgi:hypothetical protein
MSNVHILPDENLGGGPNGQILREFVEVDRKAEIGEKIIVTNAFMNGSYYDNGDIFTVIERYDLSSSERPDCVGVYVKEIGDNYGIRDYEYKTLEPTDIVRLREENDTERRYRLVDRKAKVGDKIIIVEEYEGHDWFKSGETAIVKNTLGDGAVWADFNGNQRVYKDGKWGVSYGQYLVLEPVEPAEEGDDVITVDETEASKSVIDLLANLARRVTELEREFERYKDITQDKYDLINARLSEIEKRVTVIDEHNDVLIDRMNDAEEKLEMILDDIFTLDERTQPLVSKRLDKPIGEESPFAPITIPTFKYSELVGKTLKIYGGRDGDRVIVFGYDESTGESYVLFNGKEGEGR